MESESSKIGSHLQCFKSQGFSHIASKCPTKALVLYEEEKENKEDDIEEVYEPNMAEINVRDD